jgi:hypothetical protein
MLSSSAWFLYSYPQLGFGNLPEKLTQCRFRCLEASLLCCIKSIEQLQVARSTLRLVYYIKDSSVAISKLLY